MTRRRTRSSATFQVKCALASRNQEECYRWQSRVPSLNGDARAAARAGGGGGQLRQRDAQDAVFDLRGEAGLVDARRQAHGARALLTRALLAVERPAVAVAVLGRRLGDVGANVEEVLGP